MLFGFGFVGISLWPAEVGRVYRLLEMVSRGCPGHGPVHLLSASAAEIGFTWDPVALAWSRPGLPLLSNLAGPVQHFRAAIFDGINGDSPWAQDPAEGAVNILECALGRYSSGLLTEWQLPAGFDV